SKRRPQDVPPPFQIWTPIAQVEAAVDAARVFVDPPATWSGCLELRRVESRVIDNDALTSLGTLDATTAANPNTWAIGSYRFGLFGLLRLPTREPLAMTQSPGSSDRVALRVLDRYTTE